MLEGMSRYANRVSGGDQAGGGRRGGDASAVSFTGRVAGWSARHRWRVVIGAIALLVISFLLSSSIGVKTERRCLVRVNPKRPSADRGPVRAATVFDSVIIKNPNLDVEDPAFRSTVDPLVEKLRGLDGVLDVESYYESGAPHLGSEEQACCHCPRGA